MIKSLENIYFGYQLFLFTIRHLTITDFLLDKKLLVFKALDLHNHPKRAFTNLVENFVFLHRKFKYLNYFDPLKIFKSI